MDRTEISLQKLVVRNFLVFAIAAATPIGCIAPAQAQITPDNTLGVEASRVTPNVLIKNGIGDRIDGGAIRESNLFHSFSEFNINDGQRVYFSNPSGVINILMRVTGGNASNILGTLGVDGNANLFLMNPNGILFGKNASLDVRGSFVGTTANGLQFGNQGVFSATNPQAPALLTINPNALVFSQQQSGAVISNQSQAPAGKDPAGVDVFGLRVPDGKSLLLIGGNVSMDGGWAIANGGHIELGGLTQPGSIGIQTNGDNFSLSFPEGVQRGDVLLNNRAIVRVSGNGGGSVVANARNLEILGNSKLFAGIDFGSGTANTQAGDISVNTRNLIIKDSQLSTNVSGEGNAGNLKIIASDSVELSGEIYDDKKGSLEGILATNPGGILATLGEAGKGKSGNIYLETRRLSVSDGSKVQVATFGEGDAGSLFIRANEIDVFETEKPNFYSTGIFTTVGIDPRTVKLPKGNAGNLTIETGKLTIRNGGEIDVSTQGEGNGGQLSIKASDSIEVTGNSPYNSSISAGVGDRGVENGLGSGVGNGGSITIETPQLILKDGGLIISNTSGKGNAGTIDITTGSLSVTNGSQINSFTGGQGNAGNITIQARDVVSFDGTDSNGDKSGLFSVVGEDAIGNGGIVSITSGSFSLTNGGSLGIYVSDASDALQGKKATGGRANINVSDAFTISGEGSGIFASLGSGVVGNGGDVNIKAGNLFIQDSGEISSFLASGAEGRGGNIDIQSRNLLMKNGSEINSSTYGIGNSGNIAIATSDAISLDKESYIYNNVQSREAEGNAGKIDIITGSLSVNNASQINSLTRGQGNAGNITIQSKDTISFDGLGILSSGVDSNAVGDAGKIDITTGSLFLTNGSQIATSTRGKGNAADIKIQARDAIILDSFLPFNEKSNFFTALISSVETGAVGNGGNIDISGSSLSLTNGGKILVGIDKKTDVLSGGQGTAGNVNINVHDALTISGSNSEISGALENGAIGRAGNIKVQAGNLLIRDGGRITTFTDGKGEAGNISITSHDKISLDKSIITNLVLDEAIGNAGKIDILTGSLSLTNGAQISSSTRGRGNAANIAIQANHAVTLDGFQFFDNKNSIAYTSILSDVNAGAVGNGGDIDITAGSLFLTNGAQLGVGVDGKTNTLPGGQGIGGKVNINVRDTFTISGTNSGIFGTLGNGAIGRSGNIDIQARNVFVIDDGNITSSTFGQGDSGDISITANNSILLDVGDIYTNVQSRDTVGNAGKIDITTGSLSLTNGAQINSFTRGQGNAGNINITAKDAITFDGTDSNGNESGLFSVVGEDAIGNGGIVSITSGSFSLTNGGSLGIYVSDASDALQGKKATGGTANINVRDSFTISGEGSGIFASLGFDVVGEGGDITIKVANLFIKDNGEISSNNYGEGSAGDIGIDTNFLNISNRAGIFTGTFGQGNGGNITVSSQDAVEILNDSKLDSGVAQSARGNSGDITIKTGRLIVRNSQIGPSTFGEGNAGNFKIIATDSVELSGQIDKREGDNSPEGSVGFPGGLFAQIDALGKGRGGNLSVETRRLSVSDGSKIQAATFGDGDAGNVFIRADEIDLFETERPNFYSTGIFAGVQTDGRIEAGIIDPRGGRLPQGNGGNLTIEVGKLSVRNGAEIFAETTGIGDAGNIFIRASESVNVIGVSTGTLERQRTSKITASASETSTGNAGSLAIETPLLNVVNGGFISSTSEGTGNAGILTINANTIRLDNKASLNANTRSPNKDPNKEQATINLNTNALILRRNSNITTNATGTNVIGGNININADVLAAFENSDISANSSDFRGGRVKITSQGIFGTQARSFPTAESDITATGASPTLSGTTEINTPDVDPTKGIIELPNDVVDATTQLSQLCPRGYDAFRKPLSEFIITGHDALPPSPLDPLQGTARIPLATLDDGGKVEGEKIQERQENKSSSTPQIIEAQGLVKTADGGIYLVAIAANVTPSSGNAIPKCPIASP